jgi:hypothetical protein
MRLQVRALLAVLRAGCLSLPAVAALRGRPLPAPTHSLGLSLALRRGSTASLRRHRTCLRQRRWVRGIFIAETRCPVPNPLPVSMAVVGANGRACPRSAALSMLLTVVYVTAWSGLTRHRPLLAVRGRRPGGFQFRAQLCFCVTLALSCRPLDEAGA